MHLPVPPSHDIGLTSVLATLASVWGMILGRRLDAVALPSQLAAADAPAGTSKYVEALRCDFVYDPSSTLADDGLTVIAGVQGGAWLRQEPARDAWGQQGTWFIHPGTGSDLNTGADGGHPIKTLAEWKRRTSGFSHTEMVVSLMADVPDTDPLPYELGTEGPGYLILRGTRTSVDTGTVTGYVGFNAATQPVAKLSDATQDWATHVGRLVHIHEQDAWLRVVQDLTNGDCLVTRAYASDDLIVYPSVKTPAPGNTYTVYTLSKVYVPLGFTDDYNHMVVRTQDACTSFTDLDIRAEEELLDVTITSSEGLVIFNRCDLGVDIAVTIEGRALLWETRSGEYGLGTWGTGIVFSPHGAGIGITAHVALDTSGGGRCDFIRGGVTQIARGGLFVNGASCIVYHGTVANYGPWNVSNSYMSGVEVRANASVNFASGSGGSWLSGTNNTGYGLRVYPGGRVNATNAAAALSITGTTTDLRVGDSDSLLANADTHSHAALGAAPTLDPCVTWAQFAAAPFSGRAFNYLNGAYVGP